MTTLTPTQWRVLTYLRQQRMMRNADSIIKSECGIPTLRETQEALNYLQIQGLVKISFQRLDARRMWFAVLDERASGMVGVEFPVMEAVTA